MGFHRIHMMSFDRVRGGMAFEAKILHANTLYHEAENM